MNYLPDHVIYYSPQIFKILSSIILSVVIVGSVSKYKGRNRRYRI